MVGYLQMVTILHRGDGGSLGTPKSDYVICAPPHLGDVDCLTYVPYFSALIAAWSMVSNIYIFMISFALFGTKNAWLHNVSLMLYNTEVQTGFNKLFGFLNFQTGFCSPSVSWVVSAPHCNISSFLILCV